jgi:hypothetical protein
MTKNKHKEKFEMAEIKRRLKILQLADRLGSVVEACKQNEFSRTQFYHYKKRYEELGLEGLRPISNVVKNHPQTTPDSIKQRIKILCLQNPSIGAQQLSAMLKEEGTILSSTSVHHILEDYVLSKRRARWIFLENLFAIDPDELSENQLHFLNKMNPCHQEKNNQGDSPGAIIVQDYIQVYKDKTLGKLYVHYAIDTFSNIAFACVEDSIEPKAAMQLLQKHVLPFYKNAKIQIKKIITHSGRTYCGNSKHDFQMFLGANSIKSESFERSLGANINGFSERFSFIFSTEYTTEIKRLVKNYNDEPTLTAIQNNFATWLKHYNNGRGHFGFPNYSIVPMHKHRESLIT